MRITKLSKPDLLYTLSRQYFNGVTTMGKCPDCDRSGRGGGYCKQCLIDELVRRGVSAGMMHKYCQHQNKRLNVIDKLEKLSEEIVNAD